MKVGRKGTQLVLWLDICLVYHLELLRGEKMAEQLVAWRAAMRESPLGLLWVDV